MGASKKIDFVYELCKFPNRKRSFGELSNIFDVSTRTIRNRCSELEYIANSCGLGKILEYTTGGVSFIGSSDSINAIIEKMQYDVYLSAEERIVIIILMLLTADSFVSIQDISNSLFISKSTILNDMTKVRTYFEQYQIEIASTSKGYSLNNDEQKRQDVICATCFPYISEIDEINPQKELSSTIINSVLQIDDIIDIVAISVNEVETMFGLSVSDTFYKQTVYTLAVLCSRLIKKKRITSLNYSDITIAKTSVEEIARILLRKCSEKLEFEYGELEILYLAYKLHLCHFDLLQNFEHSSDLHFYTEVLRFLSSLDKEIGTDFLNDHGFSMMLTRHIWSICNGSLNSYDFNNMSLLENYSYYYQIIKKNMHIIEQCINRKCTDNEVLSILLYVVSEIDRKEIKRNKPRIIVLCHVGIGTGHYLANRLSETFNIEILEVSSVHKLPVILKKGEFDLIISTVPLTDKSINHVTVSPSLDDNDILAVQKAIVITQRKIATGQLSSNNEILGIRKYLENIYAATDVVCDNWEEALIAASLPLMHNKCIEFSYIDAVVQSMKINGPYFVFWPGVALVHAAPTDGVNKFCMSINRLKNPVKFFHKSNDPVSIVIMVGIVDTKTQVTYITSIMNKFSNSKFLEKINAATNENEIIDLIVSE